MSILEITYFLSFGLLYAPHPPFAYEIILENRSWIKHVIFKKTHLENLSILSLSSDTPQGAPESLKSRLLYQLVTSKKLQRDFSISKYLNQAKPLFWKHQVTFIWLNPYNIKVSLQNCKNEYLRCMCIVHQSSSYEQPAKMFNPQL